MSSNNYKEIWVLLEISQIFPDERRFGPVFEEIVEKPLKNKKLMKGMTTDTARRPISRICPCKRNPDRYTADYKSFVPAKTVI